MQILNYVLCLIECLIVYIFFERIFKKRVKFESWLLIAVINSVFIYFVPSFNWLKAIVSTLSIFIGSSILYKEKVYIKSMFSITLMYIFYIIDIVSGNILSFFTNKQVLDIFYRDLIGRLAVCLCIKFIDIVAVVFLYKAFKKSGLDLSKKAWLLFNVVMTVFLSVTVAFMTIYPYCDNSFSIELMMLIISLSFLVMSVIVIYFFTYICTSFQQNKKLYFLQTSYEAIQEKLVVQEQNSIKLSKIRHDMRNHLLNVKNLLDLGDIQQANQILSNAVGQTDNISIGLSQSSGNSVIDAVVAYKATVCFNKGISFEYLLETLPKLPIDAIDISSVVSNLMDNAIEAAEKTEEPFVNVTISVYRNYLLVFVKNSCMNNPSLSHDKASLISTKSDKNVHGFGLQIVNDIADKYNGSCEWNYSDNSFSASVLLNICM